MTLLKPFPNCDTPIGIVPMLVAHKPIGLRRQGVIEQNIYTPFVGIINVFPFGKWGSKKINTEILLTSTHQKLLKKQPLKD